MISVRYHSSRYGSRFQFVRTDSVKGRTELQESNYCETVITPAYNMKNDEFVPAVEPAMSPPLSEGGKTRNSRVAKDMTSVCSIFEVNFRNLVEEYNFNAKLV